MQKKPLFSGKKAMQEKKREKNRKYFLLFFLSALEISVERGHFNWQRILLSFLTEELSKNSKTLWEYSNYD